MCDSLKYMANLHPESKPEYVEFCVEELARTIAESSQCVTTFVTDIDAGDDNAVEDFRGKLIQYQSEMRNCREEVALAYKLFIAGVLSMWTIVVLHYHWLTKYA